MLAPEIHSRRASDGSKQQDEGKAGESGRPRHHDSKNAFTCREDIVKPAAR